MRRGRRLLLTAGLGCLALAAFGAPSGAAAPWQASPAFSLHPEPFPGPTAGATSAHYRLFDPQGRPLPFPAELPLSNLIKVVRVPPVPGVYTLEAWLEDAAGQELRRATASLPFDDVAPSPPSPTGPDRWLLGTEAALLEIGAPSAPPPLSGVRGYAISTDRGGGSAPCPELVCTAADVDLEASGGGSFSLGTLPEGTTYARVATVSGSGVPSAVETFAVEVDATLPTVSLTGAPSGWSDRPVAVTARARDELSGMAAAGPLGPFTAIAVDGGAPAVAAGGVASAWVGGSGVHRIEFFARDAAGNLSGGGPGGPRRAAATVRVDEAPPRVLFAPAQDPAEPERIEARVEDELSGVDPSRGSIQVRLAGTRARFEELPTKVGGGTLVAHWDSDAYPSGKYEFLAVGFDAAGNAGSGRDRERGGRMVLVNPLKASAEIVAGLRGREGAAPGDAGYGQRARYGGRLAGAGGTPAAGLTVAVTEVFAPGAVQRQRTTLVRTRADGSFSLRLSPGPSREVAAAFAGSKLLSRVTSDSSRLAVRSSVRLRSSAATAKVGGAPVVFSGRVGRLGAGGAGGLPVELQFRYPGAGWSEFRTLEADARGRFRYAYRFSDDDSRGVRFRFRALVPGREGWPYAPASSRPVSVTGR